MRKRELERFEKKLLARRLELLEDMNLLKGRNAATIRDATGEHSHYTYHMADLATDAMEREKAFHFASKSGRLLYHVNEALRRIKNGTYGK
jgi:RNA polymerase-binding transcription factor DksA